MAFFVVYIAVAAGLLFLALLALLVTLVVLTVRGRATAAAVRGAYRPGASAADTY